MWSFGRVKSTQILSLPSGDRVFSKDLRLLYATLVTENKFKASFLSTTMLKSLKQKLKRIPYDHALINCLAMDYHKSVTYISNFAIKFVNNSNKNL